MTFGVLLTPSLWIKKAAKLKSMLLAAAFFALARQDVGSQHALSDAATPQEEPALLWGSADSTPDAWDPTTWPRDLFHPNPASLSFRVDSNLTSTAPTRHGGRLPPTGELRTRAQGVASDGPALCWKRSASSIWLAEQAQAGTVAEAGRSQRPPSESSLRLLGHWVLPWQRPRYGSTTVAVLPYIGLCPLTLRWYCRTLMGLPKTQPQHVPNVGAAGACACSSPADDCVVGGVDVSPHCGCSSRPYQSDAKVIHTVDPHCWLTRGCTQAVRAWLGGRPRCSPQASELEDSLLGRPPEPWWAAPIWI